MSVKASVNYEQTKHIHNDLIMPGSWPHLLWPPASWSPSLGTESTPPLPLWWICYYMNIQKLTVTNKLEWPKTWAYDRDPPFRVPILIWLAHRPPEFAGDNPNEVWDPWKPVFRLVFQMIMTWDGVMRAGKGDVLSSNKGQRRMNKITISSTVL